MYGEDNAHAAYAAHLNVESASNRGYHPNFTLKKSNSVQQARTRRWKDAPFEIEPELHAQ